MSDNVVEFNKFAKEAKENNKPLSSKLFTLDMYITEDNEYEVYLEMDDDYDNELIFEAMVSASMKFAVDHDLVQETPSNQLDLILDQRKEIEEQRDDIANRQDNSND